MSSPVSSVSRDAILPFTRIRYDRLSLITPRLVNGPLAIACAPLNEIVSRPHAGDSVSFRSPAIGRSYEPITRRKSAELLRFVDTAASGSWFSTWSESDAPITNTLARLIVVIDRRDDPLRAARRLRQDEAEERVDVRAPARDRDREVVGDRRTDVAAGIDEVDLRGAVDAVGLGRPGLERDDAAVVPPEPAGKAAGVKGERLEHLGVEDRRPAEEVKQPRDLVA